MVFLRASEFSNFLTFEAEERMWFDQSSGEGYPWKSSSSWQQPRWPWLPDLQVRENWARIHSKSGTNDPIIVSTVMCPLWGRLESDKKHTEEGVKLKIPVCWPCRQRGKHSIKYSFGGPAIALGMGLLQRYDLRVENKKCTCLWLSHLHLCCATM